MKGLVGARSGPARVVMTNGSDIGSVREARADADVVSRFATCCKALGLTVYDRRRPADLNAARTGFAALTRMNAQRLYGAASVEVRQVTDAWSKVGVAI